MGAKVVKFKFIKKNNIDLKQVYCLCPTCLGVITLARFTLLEWGVHINGIFLVEKSITCSYFTLLVNMYEKFVLACLSCQISG